MAGPVPCGRKDQGVERERDGKGERPGQGGSAGGDWAKGRGLEVQKSCVESLVRLKPTARELWPGGPGLIIR